MPADTNHSVCVHVCAFRIELLGAIRHVDEFCWTLWDSQYTVGHKVTTMQLAMYGFFFAFKRKRNNYFFSAGTIIAWRSFYNVLCWRALTVQRESRNDTQTFLGVGFKLWKHTVIVIVITIYFHLSSQRLDDDSLQQWPFTHPIFPLSLSFVQWSPGQQGSGLMDIYEPQCLMAHFRHVGFWHNECAYSCPWRVKTLLGLLRSIEEHVHLLLQYQIKIQAGSWLFNFFAASWKFSVSQKDANPKLPRVELKLEQELLCL